MPPKPKDHSQMTALRKPYNMHFDADEDPSDYDPKYLALGKKVIRDGRGVRRPLFLTDAAPRAPLLHKPGQVHLSDAQIDVRERALAARSARLRDAWKPGSPLASSDDDDMYEIANRIAPMLGLAPPKRNITRRPMDADPDQDPDQDQDQAGSDRVQAALDARARYKRDAWKTRARR
jgi:hypothetical protein